MSTNRRAFLGSVGAGLFGTRLVGAATQSTATTAAPPVPTRKVKTTPLFKSPEGYPNALAVAPPTRTASGW